MKMPHLASGEMRFLGLLVAFPAEDQPAFREAGVSDVERDLPFPARSQDMEEVIAILRVDGEDGGAGRVLLLE